jgi:hypothetical protein
MTTTLNLTELSSSLEAAGQARAAVRKALADADRDTIDNACLLVDELVASALLHVGAPVQVVIEDHPDRVVIEVLDGSGGSDAHVGVVERLGMTRTMLDAWAADWGTVEHPTSASVWFAIATS